MAFAVSLWSGNHYRDDSGLYMLKLLLLRSLADQSFLQTDKG
jgi:hypothetical protein